MDEDACTCSPFDGKGTLYIEEGGVYVEHFTCGKPLESSIADRLVMDPVRVRLEWGSNCSACERGCGCTYWMSVTVREGDDQ
jgi:hypothetical protein